MSNAASIFSDYLARIEAGEDIDLESVCREHPELEAELRAFHASWKQLGPVLRLALPSGSIAKRISELHGKGVDPGVELEPDDHESTSFSSDVLRRLSEHAGGFGRYRIRGEVARGGQGAVLRVWDEDLRRNLAMKVILGSGEESSGDTPHVDPKTLGRFLEEAQVTGQLDHPGIVPVHELGLDAEGRVYFTMKLVKGQTLREVFDKVRRSEDGWTVTRALGVLLKVCEAMSYAHAKHVIHRDLKPANVMVGRFGEVYVMDWGLARVVGREDPKDIRIQAPPTTQSVVRSERRERAGDTPDSPLVTMDGDVVGTPAYMSPEQAKGQLDLAGPPSDVYSVGAMLYHLLSGQMPYVPPDGKLNNYAVWQRVQEGPPQPVGQLARVSPELTSICEKAMARGWQQRYPDMSSLADDVRAYLEGKVVAAHSSGVVVELRKWILRNRVLAGSVAGVAALLVLAGATVLKLSAVQAANDELERNRLEETVMFDPQRTKEEKSGVLARLAEDILTGRASQQRIVRYARYVSPRKLQASRYQGGGDYLAFHAPVGSWYNDTPELGARVRATFHVEDLDGVLVREESLWFDARGRNEPGGGTLQREIRGLSPGWYSVDVVFEIQLVRHDLGEDSVAVGEPAVFFGEGWEGYLLTEKIEEPAPHAVPFERLFPGRTEDVVRSEAVWEDTGAQGELVATIVFPTTDLVISFELGLLEEGVQNAESWLSVSMGQGEPVRGAIDLPVPVMIRPDQANFKTQIENPEPGWARVGNQPIPGRGLAKIELRVGMSELDAKEVTVVLRPALPFAGDFKEYVLVPEIRFAVQ